MNWRALKNNRCPKCNKDLATAEACQTTTGPGIKHSCGFVISNKKFSEIVADRVAKNLIYEDAEVIEQDVFG